MISLSFILGLPRSSSHARIKSYMVSMAKKNDFYPYSNNFYFTSFIIIFNYFTMHYYVDRKE